MGKLVILSGLLLKPLALVMFAGKFLKNPILGWGIFGGFLEDILVEVVKAFFIVLSDLLDIGFSSAFLRCSKSKAISYKIIIW